MLPPFNENSTRDRLLREVDLFKTVGEFMVGTGLISLKIHATTALTHPKGVRLSGYAKMLSTVPSNSDNSTAISILSQQEFFSNGKEYPVMVRLSSLGQTQDDREMKIRGAAVKFSSHPVRLRSRIVTVYYYG